MKKLLHTLMFLSLSLVLNAQLILEGSVQDSLGRTYIILQVSATNNKEVLVKLAPRKVSTVLAANNSAHAAWPCEACLKYKNRLEIEAEIKQLAACSTSRKLVANLVFDDDKSQFFFFNDFEESKTKETYCLDWLYNNLALNFLRINDELYVKECYTDINENYVPIQFLSSLPLDIEYKDFELGVENFKRIGKNQKLEFFIDITLLSSLFEVLDFDISIKLREVVLSENGLPTFSNHSFILNNTLTYEK